MSKKPSDRRLRIPVRFVDGFWECAWGGPVPAKEHATAELLLSPVSIEDEAFLRALQVKERYQILSENTALLVAMSVRQPGRVPESLRHLLIPWRHLKAKIAPDALDRWNVSTSYFVEVKIGSPDNKQRLLFDSDRGGLWLSTQGYEPVGLESTTIILPAEVSDRPVSSLNHAYTTLSEIFETTRISHTGNIYTRVFYKETDGIWYPLDLLRNHALHKKEQRIAKRLWDAFMKKMSSVNLAGGSNS